jgi:CubicO group peptidase (beta-lactamase class C family)
VLAERLEPVLSRVRARRGGLAIGVWDGDETLLWHAGELPDGVSSIFEIGSITKVFTATLLADMASDGLVALDDPVSLRLPEGVRVPVRGREITLEDLACHRSGLPRLPKGLLRRALTRERHDPYARVDAAWLDRAVPRTATRSPAAPAAPSTSWCASASPRRSTSATPAPTSTAAASLAGTRASAARWPTGISTRSPEPAACALPPPT